SYTRPTGRGILNSPRCALLKMPPRKRAFSTWSSASLIVPLSPSKGRAPYLHILNWLANAESWTLDLRDAIRNNPDLRGSVGQVLDNLAERELEVFYDKM